MKVGDRVVIRRTSPFYDITADNPDDSVAGTVRDMKQTGGLCIHVDWDNGQRNGYREADLLVVGEERVPAVPKKQPTLASVLNKAAKVINGRDTGSNGHFVFVTLDDGKRVVSEKKTGPCHATALTYGRSHKTEYILTRIQRQDNVAYTQCSEELCLEYYDWLFNRSGWKQCFRSRSVSKAWKDKVAVLTCKAPANLVQAALIATRNTWEYANVIKRWKKYKDAGINENLAFALAHVTYDDGDTIRISVQSDPHNALSGSNMTVKGAKAFVKCKPLYTQKDYIDAGQTAGATKVYEGISTAKNPQLASHLQKLFDEHGRQGSGETNPFSKAKAKPAKKSVEMGAFVEIANGLLKEKT